MPVNTEQKFMKIVGTEFIFIFSYIFKEMSYIFKGVRCTSREMREESDMLLSAKKTMSSQTLRGKGNINAK